MRTFDGRKEDDRADLHALRRRFAKLGYYDPSSCAMAAYELTDKLSLDEAVNQIYEQDKNAYSQTIMTIRLPKGMFDV